MMGFTPMTQPQAVKLAAFIASIRHDWQRPGIEDALGKARHLASPAQLAIAAIEAARDDGNRTPAVIALDGRHWHTTAAPPPRFAEPAPEDRCSVCFHERHACDARRRTDPEPHAFLSIPAARALAEQRRTRITEAAPVASDAPSTEDETT
jgi:hypothetical protein